jgi:lysophospholipase L1-like esterase
MNSGYANKNNKLNNWLACLLGVLFPLVIILSLELIFHFLNLYPYKAFEDSYVTYEKELIFFPEWEKEISMPKSPDTYRIFVLGGSVAQGFGVEVPFSKLIEDKLNQASLNKRCEVINGGVGAAGSHRVFEVLKRACTYDPDLIIVYLGHNEFVEEMFLGPKGLYLKAIRLSQFLKQSRVINFLSSFVPKFRFKPELRLHFFGSRKFPLIHSQEQYEVRLKFLELNINKMIDYTKSRRTGILFVPAVPNLLAPIISIIHSPAYQSRSQEYNNIAALLKTTNDSLERIKLYTKLNAIDNQFASSHYYLGLEWLENNNLEKGKQELILANQFCKDGDRANSDIIRVITNVCNRKGIPVLDVTDQFYAELLEEYKRYRWDENENRLFIDECHPTERGHEIIANVITGYLIKKLSM